VHSYPTCLEPTEDPRGCSKLLLKLHASCAQSLPLLLSPTLLYQTGFGVQLLYPLLPSYSPLLQLQATPPPHHTDLPLHSTRWSKQLLPVPLEELDRYTGLKDSFIIATDTA
jgi:hypothetical protein